jgi:hypothetical protein
MNNSTRMREALCVFPTREVAAITCPGVFVGASFHRNRCQS